MVTFACKLSSFPEFYVGWSKEICSIIIISHYVCIHVLYVCMLYACTVCMYVVCMYVCMRAIHHCYKTGIFLFFFFNDC